MGSSREACHDSREEPVISSAYRHHTEFPRHFRTHVNPEYGEWHPECPGPNSQEKDGVSVTPMIGHRSHGYVALYRYIVEVDTVFVLAVRSQLEAGYAEAGRKGDKP